MVEAERAAFGQIVVDVKAGLGSRRHPGVLSALLSKAAKACDDETMSGTPETTSSDMTASDIRSGHWAYRAAPAAWRPYLKLARIDRPIGTWLLLFPCWWSLSLAAASEGTAREGAAMGPWPDPWLLLLFAVGALVMRGAGCTYNDIVDRDFDAKVARTAKRPIPSGQVSPRRAGAFLGVLLLTGLIVLLQFNGFTIALGVASLALVFTYPFMKRITYWPQAWLGLTFNWGALMGWAAVTGGLAWPPVLLYLAGLAWTLGYDTIYAHQDKEDDALIGVKSTALKLGTGTKPWVAGFYGATVLLMLSAGLGSGLGSGLPWAYLLGLAGVAGHFAWQVATLDIDDPANCLARFKANRFVGWILLAGIVAGAALP
jgi:4-hydroxybenzoate polyprenyltransferase